MKTPEYPVNDIRFFIGLGTLVIVLLAILPLMAIGYLAGEVDRFEHCRGRSTADAGCKPGIVWPFFEEMKIRIGSEIDRARVGTQRGAPSGLGREGSACGGTERLPCLPGFSCQSASGEQSGVCAKTPQGEVLRHVRMVNEACGDEIGFCDANLVCKLSPGGVSTSSRFGNGVCIKGENASPRVVSLVLKGLAYDQNRYVGAGDTKVEVSVQSANAVTVQAFLRPSSTGEQVQSLSEFTKAKGGVYATSFVMPVGFQGELEVQAMDAHGQVAAMSVKLLTQSR